MTRLKPNSKAECTQFKWGESLNIKQAGTESRRQTSKANAAYAVSGARKNAEAAGLEIVYDESYKPGTSDFTPIIRAIQATNPDAVYVGSYPPGTVGIVRAANELGLETKMFGGGMVGAQYATIQESLGSMLEAGYSKLEARC